MQISVNSSTAGPRYVVINHSSRSEPPYRSRRSRRSRFRHVANGANRRRSRCCSLLACFCIAVTSRRFVVTSRRIDVGMSRSSRSRRSSPSMSGNRRGFVWVCPWRPLAVVLLGPWQSRGSSKYTNKQDSAPCLPHHTTPHRTQGGPLPGATAAAIGSDQDDGEARCAEIASSMDAPRSSAAMIASTRRCGAIETTTNGEARHGVTSTRQRRVPASHRFWGCGASSVRSSSSQQSLLGVPSGPSILATA